MDIVELLRKLGRDDTLNALVEDKKRLTLDERESIEALQVAALKAAGKIERLRRGEPE